LLIPEIIYNFAEITILYSELAPLWGVHSALVSMTYSETLDYLYSSQPAFHQVGAAAYKPGLDNTLALMAHLGNPERCWPSVHVAGTNGKGSTSHLIAASLQAAGLKVGLYTSPHLVDFRERIRVSGEMIPEEAVVRYVEDNRAFLNQLKPSFFESTMGMAFWWFREQQVDIAVVEVGLGGRLDSTNIITPWLSVITNIGLDHTEFLGSTLPEIAFEKAGIIKPGVPCVVGESDPETDPVFLRKAEECGILGGGLETTDCKFWFADRCGYLRTRRQRLVRSCELHGAYQEKNQQTAYVALSALMAQQRPELQGLTEEAIKEGFAKVCTFTGLRGRWEILAERPLIIADTGHNSHGIRTYVESLRKLHAERSGGYNASQSDNSYLRIVFGMVQDKDVDTVLSLLPKEARYYWTQADSHRAIPASEMQRKGLSHGLIGEAFDSVETALQVVIEASSAEDIIFIGGSNYIVGEALAIIDKAK